MAITAGGTGENVDNVVSNAHTVVDLVGGLVERIAVVTTLGTTSTPGVEVSGGGYSRPTWSQPTRCTGAGYAVLHTCPPITNMPACEIQGWEGWSGDGLTRYTSDVFGGVIAKADAVGNMIVTNMWPDWTFTWGGGGGGPINFSQVPSSPVHGPTVMGLKSLVQLPYMVDGAKIVFRPDLTPAGLSPGVTYYVRDSTVTGFRVAATPGGAALDITSSGACYFGRVFTVPAGETLELGHLNIYGPASTYVPPPPGQPNGWGPATMLATDGLHPNDTGMTYLADAYEWALAQVGVTSLAGETIKAYGDSWTAADHSNTAGMRAITQLTNRLSATLSNRAVGGYRAGDCAVRAIGGGTGGTLEPNSDGLVFIAAGLNDLQHTDTAQQRTATANYLRALFAVANAAQRIEQTAFTFGGTWATTAGASSLFSGGSNAQTSSEGATATYTITTPGTYYLLMQGTNGVTYVGGQWIVSQGGTTLATVETNAQDTNTTVALSSGYGPLSARIEGVQAGTLTITYNKAGRAGTVWGFLDGLVRIDDVSPPRILAVKPVEVTKTSHVRPALLDFIRDTYDSLATEFGHT